MKYECDGCGWVYDEELGSEENLIKAGTSFDELSEHFMCPECGERKNRFLQLS